ncbi:sonic hedgehog protein-like isoform X2 [Dendronephthya gigantea]|uniref:sonic hedgehog protein-like isoform X2 n=1 Tax=Dendronephthya gigantea TaxID=151771 RepID=UPI00106C4BE8|nr:sonic hedgehog protein-like isoform X2 [Dendronephthya gigantea]
MISDLKKNLVIWHLLLCFIRPVICCLPKNGGSIRRSPRTPFYLHQKVPDIDEYSQGASGQPGDPINYSRAFKVLKTNYNPGIVFEQNSEKTGDTRLMSKRCMDALNKLGTLVKQKWPRIKLRVIVAWDQQTVHRSSGTSLHFEGRAVDITTSDKDRSKLGLLARLAVEAGFDWVKYVHKQRVHASVRVGAIQRSD